LNHDLSRRELILRGALAGAALTLPGVDAMAAVRARTRKRSVHCLPAIDRFAPESVVRDCSFLTWAPDGQRLALETSRGIEIHDYRDGSRKTVTPPGFTLTADAWHRSGTLFLASGPAEDGTGPYIHAVDPATGAVVRLLQDYPGTARAACFSPDGRKVAFTYVNRYIHQLCMADWARGQLANPLLLIPFDPATEPLIDKFQNGMSWYETRGFSANGQRLYFASDRTSGMLNVNVHFIELATAKRHRVTADQGVVEGLVVSNDDSTVYFSGTRARESGFLTLVTGPAVAPVLGFVAEPTLHKTLAERHLAPIGNGDVLAVDETYGMGARMVGERRRVVDAVGSTSGIENWLYRTIACSMSPDGRRLAVAAISNVASDVVLLRRPASGVPKPKRVRRTLGPRGAVPLPKDPFPDLDRTFTSDFGGQAHIQLAGTLEEGHFRATLDNFNADGVRVLTGPIEFQTSGGNFRHSADIVRLDYDETEEANTFYRANMNVNWNGVTDGTLDSRSRHGTTSAAWDGTTFAKVAPWRAGRRTPEPIPGSKSCPDTGRS
jgi:hypothetical protein